MFLNVAVIVSRCQALMALEDLHIVPELDEEECLDGGLDEPAVDDDAASNFTGSSKQTFDKTKWASFVREGENKDDAKIVKLCKDRMGTFEKKQAHKGLQGKRFSLNISVVAMFVFVIVVLCAF